jgi:hypothetical protein
VWVEQRDPALDHTRFGQPAHPAQRGRGRRSGAFGQLLVRQGGVALKQFEQADVGGVQIHREIMRRKVKRILSIISVQTMNGDFLLEVGFI